MTGRWGEGPGRCGYLFFTVSESDIFQGGREIDSPFAKIDSINGIERNLIKSKQSFFTYHRRKTYAFHVNYTLQYFMNN